MTTILLQLETCHKSNINSATDTRRAIQPPEVFLMNDQYDASDLRVLEDETSVNTIIRVTAIGRYIDQIRSYRFLTATYLK